MHPRWAPLHRAAPLPSLGPPCQPTGGGGGNPPAVVCHQPVVPAQVAQPQAPQIQRQLVAQPLPAARPKGSTVPPIPRKQLVSAVPQQHHAGSRVAARRRVGWAPALLPLALLLVLPRCRRRHRCRRCATWLRVLPGCQALGMGWQQGSHAASSQPEGGPYVQVHHRIRRGQQAQQAGARRLDVRQRAVHLAGGQGGGGAGGGG